MTPEQRIPHSFNRPSFVPNEKYPTLRPSHRRSRSEPKFGRHQDIAPSLFAEGLHIGLRETVHSPPRHFDPDVPRLAPAAAIPLRLKPQYSIRRPRPDSGLFGVSANLSPEIVLGEPKQHIGHPKTRIGQPVLKLAAIKERMELLEAANERMQHRIESNRTDAEMLSSSVTYFSSEYYAGLLTIRELRARSRQDAEIMSNQEQQLCQLKKFVGLMVEIGLHEPILERAHVSVLKRENFEPALVEAIRNAAARPGSAWTGILDAVATTTTTFFTFRDPIPETVQSELPADATEVFEERRQTTVDDLLTNLKDGNIPSGRHRSASQRFVNQPTVTQKSGLKISKVSKTSLSPPSPARCALRQLDDNRSLHSQAPDVSAGGSQTPMRRTPSSTPVKERRLEKLPRIVATSGTTSFSGLASLQQLLDTFSSGSFGSLGTTTDETQSAGCDSLTEMAGYSAPSPAIKTKSPGRIRPCAETATKRTIGPAPSSANKELGRPSVSPVRSRRPSASGTLSRKSGWR